MINIWIGYDSQFDANIGILEKSIIFHNKKYPIKINYLKLNLLNQLLHRPRCAKQTTDSAFTRWLIPYLQEYAGWAIYLDSDTMLRKDISMLWDLRKEDKSVQVVKHEFNDVQISNKFNNNIQTNYQRKNWSSVMIFNCKKCKSLSLKYINTAAGLNLHQFNWLKDTQIGDLPKEWNYLVGINEPTDAALVHWTLGGPWLGKYKNAEYSVEWRQY